MLVRPFDHHDVRYRGGRSDDSRAGESGRRSVFDPRTLKKTQALQVVAEKLVKEAIIAHRRHEQLVRSLDEARVTEKFHAEDSRALQRDRQLAHHPPDERLQVGVRSMAAHRVRHRDVLVDVLEEVRLEHCHDNIPESDESDSLIDVTDHEIRIVHLGQEHVSLLPAMIRVQWFTRDFVHDHLPYADHGHDGYLRVYAR
eukprot:CAMPEP_0117516286 /NCGR_PEP_ID=MMETSP0784-20121206/31017_1 /TAXON_ID=39447 /ORGANISM="" /LENGTH=198 /DNA_ID=CAMNT_0005312129 /DNA_START=406 /DNA_END=1002 /DNA_ORIENTATION=-